MRRALAGLGGAVLVVLAAGYLARGFIGRKAVEMAVARQTGFELKVAALYLGLFGGQIEIRGLELMNPPEFQERTFVDLPFIHVEYDTLSLLRRRPHLRSIVARVDRVCIVTDEKGERNVTRLEHRVAEQGGQSSSKALGYRVDLLQVHVGTVVFEDWSGGRHTTRKLSLNADATYHNLSEKTPVSELVLGSALRQVGLGSLGQGLGESLQGATQNLGKAGQGLLDALKKAH